MTGRAAANPAQNAFTHGNGFLLTVKACFKMDGDLGRDRFRYFSHIVAPFLKSLLLLFLLISFSVNVMVVFHLHFTSIIFNMKIVNIIGLPLIMQTLALVVV